MDDRYDLSSLYHARCHVAIDEPFKKSCSNKQICFGDMKIEVQNDDVNLQMNIFA